MSTASNIQQQYLSAFRRQNDRDLQATIGRHQAAIDRAYARGQYQLTGELLRLQYLADKARAQINYGPEGWGVAPRQPLA